MKSKYVIDASLVIRSLLEKDSAAFRHFAKILSDVRERKAELYAPVMLWSEVANGLRFSVKDAAIAKEKYSYFAALPITTFELSTSQYAHIIELSYQLGTTVYDTTYHHIALLLGGTFVTCDQKYAQKASALGGVEGV